MAHVAGVKVQKLVNGNIKTVTFDLKKHGELINPILKQLGVLEPDKKREEFMKEFNAGISAEEVIKRTDKFIESLPWKK